jgi:type IV secretory pathway VirB3-like protein
MQDDYFDPIYKGSTAPAMVLGVPLLPFILGAVVIGQLAVLSFYFISLSVMVMWLVIGGFAFAYARKVSQNDEHRLLQLLLKARMRGRQGATRRFWGAVSFSPLPPRK